jgi:hypothetical protein
MYSTSVCILPARGVAPGGALLGRGAGGPGQQPYQPSEIVRHRAVSFLSWLTATKIFLTLSL